MCPVAIGYGTGKEWIFLGCQPVGKQRARVGSRCHVHGFTIERFESGNLLGPFVGNGSCFLIEHNNTLHRGVGFIRSLVDLFFANPAEKRGQTPVIVLAPLFVGMMVALCACHAQPQEYLSGIVYKLFDTCQALGPQNGRVHCFIAGARNHGTGHLVVRHVAGHGITQPTMKCKGTGSASGIATTFHTQDVRPFGSKVVAVFGAVYKAVDQTRAFVGPGVRHECLHLFGGWQGTCNVEVNASQKDQVPSEIARCQPEFFPFAGGVLVYQRVFAECERLGLPCDWNHGTECGYLILKANHDRSFAAHAMASDKSAGIYRGDFYVVAFVLGPAGNVFLAAIRVVGQNSKLLARLARHHTALWVYGNRFQGWIGWFAIWHAASNPATYQFVFVGGWIQFATTAVSDGSGSLGQ